MFKALLIEKTTTSYTAAIREIDDAQLPGGDVTVRIAYSTLNYKDALAITGQGRVVRTFPMVPGIDLAGTVEESAHPGFKTGDQVLLNGYGVGESHWGGLAQRARLNGDWLLPLPSQFTPRQSMAVGTAGYTAMLCILALERHGLTPGKGDVLVTGAGGGVGGVAIALLNKLGYTVIASTGRLNESAYLQELGAHEVIDRSEFSQPGRPLAKERWAGAIDSVGSHTLANVCASMRYGAAVAACGLAQGLDFPATVAPFILRGITLIGIDSVNRPMPDRLQAWQRLAQDLDPRKLDLISHEIALSQTIEAASDILAGRLRGRVVVDVNR